jgi:DNA end-binding protein Ku
MAARPYWRGQLRLALVTCGIQLIAATTEADRIRFNRIEKGTQTKLKQQMVNPETGEVVPWENIGSGYEYEKGRIIEIDKDEIDALKIESSDIIEIERVVDAKAVDWLYWDTPYLVLPDGKNSDEIYGTIRDALKHKTVVGLGRSVIGRRERPVLVRACGKGLLLATLRDPKEVRDPAEIFDEEVGDIKVNKQNVELAETLIDRMRSDFEFSMFEDRYQIALNELIDEKLKGHKPATRKSPARAVANDNLLDALKASIAGAENVTPIRKPQGKAAAKSASKTRKRA